MIRLTKEAQNLHKLTIGLWPQSVIYFSYETPVAYIPDSNVPSVCYIAKNQWSSTTGKHLNTIDKVTPRIDYMELVAKINEGIKTSQ